VSEKSGKPFHDAPNTPAADTKLVVTCDGISVDLLHRKKTTGEVANQAEPSQTPDTSEPATE